MPALEEEIAGKITSPFFEVKTWPRLMVLPPTAIVTVNLALRGRAFTSGAIGDPDEADMTGADATLEDVLAGIETLAVSA